MVIFCLAPGCSATKDNINDDSSVLFHRFPLKKPDLLAKWVRAMRKPGFKPTVSSYLCSAHFSANDYEIKPNIGKHLKPNSVPVIFEKKKRGRKKKVVPETEIVEEVKENKEDEIMKSELLQETVEGEYIASVTKEEFSLDEIIGDQGKDALQILVVGEDGKIINSDFVLKKEIFPDEDIQPEFIAVDENEIGDLGIEEENQNKIIDNNFILTNSNNVNNEEKIKILESNLTASKKKVRDLQLKCKKMNKKLNRLKILLKLLVLKRGKGVKNLEQLLEEYEKEFENFNLNLREESCDI